jgi:hypothetical protein
MPAKKKQDQQPTTIQFHYIKGNHFRTIRTSGAIGSVTPAGHIHCALYNERPAIPRTTQHEVDADGQLVGEPIVVDGRSGLVRELEVDLILSLETAESLRDWLSDRIAEAIKVRPPKARPRTRGTSK